MQLTVDTSWWTRYRSRTQNPDIDTPSFQQAVNEALPDGMHPPVWFAFDETRPLAVFAGIWTRWTDVQGTGARLRMPESLGHGHAAVEKTTLHFGTLGAARTLCAPPSAPHAATSIQVQSERVRNEYKFERFNGE